MQNKQKIIIQIEIKKKIIIFGPQGGKCWHFTICDAIYTCFLKKIELRIENKNLNLGKLF